MEQNKLLDVLLDTFNTLKDQCKATSADLRSIKNELNRIFNDSECKEVIYTSNLDRMFFGIKVLPMIDADDIYDYLVDNESIRIDKYIVEIDSHMLNPVLDLSAAEMMATLINEVNALIGDSSPIELARNAMNQYLAINSDHLRISKSIHYKEILAYGLKDYLSKCKSMFYNTNGATDLYTSDMIVALGIADDLASAYRKIKRDNIKLYQDTEVSKFVTFGWTLRLYKDVKHHRVGTMHVLDRAKLLTGSELEKVEMDNVIKRIKRLDDEVVFESGLMQKVNAKIKERRVKSRINTLRIIDSTFYELNMRIRNVEDEDDALYLMRQINNNIAIIEEYIASDDVDDHEKKKWMEALDKFVELRQKLSDTIVYKNKNYGLFVNYPDIVEDRY